jgi:hypothetical protein
VLVVMVVTVVSGVVVMGIVAAKVGWDWETIRRMLLGLIADQEAGGLSAQMTA